MQYTGLVSKLKIKASSFLVLFFTIQNEPNHWILQQPRTLETKKLHAVWKYFYLEGWEEQNKNNWTSKSLDKHINSLYIQVRLRVVLKRKVQDHHVFLIFFSITSLTVTWLKSFNRLTTSVLQYIETSQLINLLVSTWWETLVVNGLT